MDEFLYPQSGPDFNSARRAEPCKKEKDRSPYDALRPWSALTHGLGILLAAVGTALLLLHAHWLGGSVRHYVTFALYGTAMIELYTASTLYHCINTTVRGRLILKKLDHASIYFLIAGTYTPICLISLRGPWGWSLFGVIWGLALLGVALSLLWIHSPRWVTAGIYLFMGWLALVAIFPLAAALSGKGLFWLLAGGVLYSVGGILYALKWPGRANPNFGCHEIFHLFILLGSLCHYLPMYRVVAFA